MNIIGIDIGGANTKIASANGELVEIHYMPMWKGNGLDDLLRVIAKRIRPDMVSAVMTGELADCFESKKEGIRFIADHIEEAFDCPVHYINQSGYFAPLEDIPSFAAANWAASSRMIALEKGDCVFVDMGSTTTDIIPVLSGRHMAENTDFKRLRAKQLVYTGILRTNIAALLPSVMLSSGECLTSSELFATSADAYMLLGDIDRHTYISQTADCAGKDRINCMRRIARVVCADLTEISESGIMSIAGQVKEKQKSIIGDAVEEVAEKYGLNKVICAGIGEFLVSEVCRERGLEYEPASRVWGSEVSGAFPAYSAARLLEMKYNENSER
ncbi:H4MPT-linked C1 transfer pathway protein [Methanosalsum zhilinae DSM 4017]|uniref:H4MPT-linked C1 transfer pathway protein n=1 Tax=Methanosalsum zhilinae (strain DSM 4017 / NBRC 107636 / OCM 62 / WeN5) TaxID=679901 RepID=F7XPM2_METZD|nr:hydantoinase/oxoprolinase family protein [Methanosalsum zhilinae]AEH61456.1 H4MPT-linked C1 transfer pathway protein [Methanosalsum zhilinae DSM 4017]